MERRRVIEVPAKVVLMTASVVGATGGAAVQSVLVVVVISSELLLLDASHRPHSVVRPSETVGIHKVGSLLLLLLLSFQLGQLLLLS